MGSRRPWIYIYIYIYGEYGGPNGFCRDCFQNAHVPVRLLYILRERPPQLNKVCKPFSVAMSSPPYYSFWRNTRIKCEINPCPIFSKMIWIACLHRCVRMLKGIIPRPDSLVGKEDPHPRTLSALAFPLDIPLAVLLQGSLFGSSPISRGQQAKGVRTRTAKKPWLRSSKDMKPSPWYEEGHSTVYLGKFSNPLQTHASLCKVYDEMSKLQSFGRSPL